MAVREPRPAVIHHRIPAAPYGFAVRLVTAGRSAGPDPHLWHEVAALDDHRVGVIVGDCAPSAEGGSGLRAAVSATLHETADPLRVLELVRRQSAAFAAMCAVIDRSAPRFTYSTVGRTAPVVAAPQVRHHVLDSAEGKVEVGTLPPGSTLLLCTMLTGSLDDELDRCTGLPPDEAADRLMSPLTPAGPGAVAVVYRHPPDPLTVTVAAEPASLATVRGSLRQWLALAGADQECSADALLAVGEAASNSTEHAVTGVGHAVQITVQAAVIGERLRLTVCDNGRWKPAVSSPGYRGHGIRLINALVDSADLTTTDHGTTVDMFKELRP